MKLIYPLWGEYKKSENDPYSHRSQSLAFQVVGKKNEVQVRSLNFCTVNHEVVHNETILLIYLYKNSLKIEFLKSSIGYIKISKISQNFKNLSKFIYL